MSANRDFAAPWKLPKIIMDNGQIILPAYALENFLYTSLFY